MHYRFASRRNLSDLASGRVLRSSPGLPAFPVRMAEEMFQRACMEIQASAPVVVLDPCCGAGYLLAVLGFLFPNKIHTLVGLDTNLKAVELARRNLRLLGVEGLQERLQELERLHEEHGRESHQAAVESARSLLKTRVEIAVPETLAHLADSTSASSVQEAVGARTFDLAVCDLPHGKLVSWQGRAATMAPGVILHELLDAISTVMSEDAIWIVAGAKRQRINFPGEYRGTGRMRIGHRDIYFIRRS